MPYSTPSSFFLLFLPRLPPLLPPPLLLCLCLLLPILPKEHCVPQGQQWRQPWSRTVHMVGEGK